MSEELESQLFMVIGNGDVEGVRKSLASGASPKMTATIEGVGPVKFIHFTAYVGNADVAEALLAAGADKDARDTNGMTPLREN